MSDAGAGGQSADEKLHIREDHYCFGCGRQNPHGLKLTFFPTDDGGVWCEWIVAPENQGFEGIAHGGIISTVLDEVMGWAVYHKRIWAVTARMSVAFRRPVSIGARTRASARVVSESGRRVRISAELRDSVSGQILADAEGVFIKVAEELARTWQERYIDPAAWCGDVTPG